MNQTILKGMSENEKIDIACLDFLKYNGATYAKLKSNNKQTLTFWTQRIGKGYQRRT